MLTFSIISRSHTRSTQYNKRDVLKAIEHSGAILVRDGFILYCTVQTIEQRKALEYYLRLVHRNVAYRIERSTP